MKGKLFVLATVVGIAAMCIAATTVLATNEVRDAIMDANQKFMYVLLQPG